MQISSLPPERNSFDTVNGAVYIKLPLGNPLLLEALKSVHPQ